MSVRHASCQWTWQQAIGDVSRRVYGRRFSPDGGIRPRRLALVVAPAPGESFASWVDRLAVRNGCPPWLIVEALGWMSARHRAMSAHWRTTSWRPRRRVMRSGLPQGWAPRWCAICTWRCSTARPWICRASRADRRPGGECQAVVRGLGSGDDVGPAGDAGGSASAGRGVFGWLACDGGKSRPRGRCARGTVPSQALALHVDDELPADAAGFESLVSLRDAGDRVDGVNDRADASRFGRGGELGDPRGRGVVAEELHPPG